MIDRLRNWSEHVSDEAVTTAQLLNDAAEALTEARAVIDELIASYQKTLLANGYDASTDSISRAYAFMWSGKLS